MSVSGGLYKAFGRADELNCEAMQIFTKSQLRWHTPELTKDELNYWYKVAEQSAVKEVVSHASYLINLAGEGETLVKSKASLVEELKRSESLGIKKVVLHPGSCGDRDFGISLKLLSDSLVEVLSETSYCKAKILLETMAGQGNSIGRRLEEFAQILEYTNGDKRIAFCVDTCHVFAGGYDISTEDGYEDLIEQLSKHIGLDRVLCWHLNDSKKTCASRVDRHDHLGLGQIGLTPFRLLMNDKRFKNIPALLETPKETPGDRVNLGILRGFRKEN